MTIYKHPGVYVNELPLTVTTNAFGYSAIAAGAVVAQFAKGPTTVTRVTSYSQFEDKFGSLNGSYPATYSVKLFFDNGGTDLYVRRVVSSLAPRASVVIHDDTAGTPAVVTTIESKYIGNDTINFRVKVDNKTLIGNYYYYDFHVYYSDGVQDVEVERFNAVSFDQPDSSSYIKSILDVLSSYVRVSGNVTAPGTGKSVESTYLPLTGVTTEVGPTKYDYTGDVASVSNSPVTFVANITGKTGTAASGSVSLTLNSADAEISVNMGISGTGIDTGTTVAAVNGTSLTLSKVTTSSLNATALTFTANISNAKISGLSGSASVTLVSANPEISVGMGITGPGIQDSTTVAAISGTALTLSKNLLVQPSGTVSSFATFNDFNVVDQPLVFFLPDVHKFFTSGSVVDAQYVYNSIIAWSETYTSRFTVVDTPANYEVTDATSFANGLTATSRAAVYYPHIYIKDTAAGGSSIRKVNPSGAITGLYLFNDRKSGPFKTPAGISATLADAIAIEKLLTNADLDALNSPSEPLNAIRNVPGAGIVVMGGRTLKQDGTANRYISMRRSLTYIEKSLSDLTQFAVFESNSEALWARITTVLSAFLNTYRNQGGLRGANPSDAFFVTCDATNNSAQSIAAGIVNVDVGVALQYPGEFVVINLSQIVGQ